LSRLSLPLPYPVHLSVEPDSRQLGAWPRSPACSE
jgi:hypothetical protein